MIKFFKRAVSLAFLSITLCANAEADSAPSLIVNGVEAGGVLEVENMGVLILSAVNSESEAAVTSYSVEFGDEQIATFYASIKGVVAHAAGETLMTLTPADAAIAPTEFTVRVKDVDPANKPDDDFQDGIVWLNEEWCTHTSGSLNYIDADGKVYYRAYGNQNDNMAFGCTSPFAMYYADKLFVMSKQAWDGGDTRPLRSGGRVVVADAKTMKHIAAFDEIGGDGRAAVGVSPEKVYLSHTNGIRVMHIGDEITLEPADIEGITVNRNGQMGDMVKAGKYVFAVMVGNSLVIIDTETDEVVETKAISGIQTVAQSLDGRVWIGCAKTLQSIDPETLEMGDVLTIGAGSIGCSGSSWRAGNLFASTRTNTLFWSTGNFNGSNGSLVRWDIDEVEDPSTLTVLYNHDTKAGIGAMAYGTPGYDDRTDTWMYATCNGFGVNAAYNWLNFVDASTGELKHSIRLNDYFWFPAMPVMPDKHEPVLEDFDNIILDAKDGTIEITLNPTDADNHDCNIALTLLDGDSDVEALSDDETAPVYPAKVVLKGRVLTVTPQTEGSRTLHLQMESNGKVVNKEFSVQVKSTTGIDAVEAEANADKTYFRTDGVRIQGTPAAPGVYIEKAGGTVRKIIL